MYFYGYFQTDVLVNFFISLRRAEAITWESRQRGTTAVQKGDPVQDVIYEEFITLPGSR